MRKIRKLALALLALVASFLADQVRYVSDCRKGNVRYKTVTVYQTVKIPQHWYVTKYPSCGTPYRAQVVTYKTTTVPVQKQVRIGY